MSFKLTLASKVFIILFAGLAAGLISYFLVTSALLQAEKIRSAAALLFPIIGFKTLLP